ncbi:FkbM family methyltransferase [bacterium]|nr:FkbM family methyltransferase [bacterium]
MKNPISFIQKAFLARASEIEKALNTIIAHRRGKGVPFRERLLYFLARFFYLFPIPSRFMENGIESLAHNLKLICSTSEGKIYEKNGLLFLIPKGYIRTFSEALQEIYLLSEYEEYPVEIEEGDIVIDCGANIGVASLIFARKVGLRGKVVAIEAEEANFRILRRTAELNRGKVGEIIPLRYALYKENCELKLFLSISPASHSLYKNIEHKVIREALTNNFEVVQGKTLDSIIEELNLERVDFIKMDIEGGELDALYGAKQTIANFKPKMAVSIYHRPKDPIEIRKTLLQYNPDYECREIKKRERMLFCRRATP